MGQNEGRERYIWRLTLAPHTELFSAFTFSWREPQTGSVGPEEKVDCMNVPQQSLNLAPKIPRRFWQNVHCWMWQY
ncbi:Efflux pump bik6 [Fusarium oxysporum f. sp. albedinis]|nr:Efflux pump bik6 [Fusarium oxysporum f. sp. albedinis]